jgi:hypothetical protein
MSKLRLSNLALAGALALGLGTALTVAPSFTGLDSVAYARGGGGGGGGGGGSGGFGTPERDITPPVRTRGQVVYVNEFPEDDPPIIIIPFPTRGRAAAVPATLDPCQLNQARPSARIACERASR